MQQPYPCMWDFDGDVKRSKRGHILWLHDPKSFRFYPEPELCISLNQRLSNEISADFDVLCTSDGLGSAIFAIVKQDPMLKITPKRWLWLFHYDSGHCYSHTSKRSSLAHGCMLVKSASQIDCDHRASYWTISTWFRRVSFHSTQSRFASPDVP